MNRRFPQRFGHRFAGLTIALLAALALANGRPAAAHDWIFDQSEYSNSPTTGKRVEQYKKIDPVQRIPYDKFFSPDGPHPYIPYWYYQNQMGWPYGYGYGYGSYYGAGSLYAPLPSMPYLAPHPLF